MIVTAADISKSALRRKAVTRASEEGLSWRQKCAEMGLRLERGGGAGGGGWGGALSERPLWLAAADLGDDGFSPEASNEG